MPEPSIPEIVAMLVQVPSATDGIEHEDADGKWQEELADGRDRPQTEVSD